MAELKYTPEDLHLDGMSYEEKYLRTEFLEVSSLYSNEKILPKFIEIKTTLVDFDHPLVLRTISGTEQEYIVMMEKAKEAIKRLNNVTPTEEKILLKMFKDCVFGYYVLEPLINDPTISDIHVNSWNNITCKRKGLRYITNLTFVSQDDYDKWYKRIATLNKVSLSEMDALKKTMDLESSPDYRLRLDFEFKCLVSTKTSIMHIRKFPKVKATWQELFDAGLLNKDMRDYIENRVGAGYSFLLSGEGGSGKSTLLNLIIDLISYNKRVLVGQETAELYTDKHPHMIFEETLEIETQEKIKNYTLEEELKMGLLQDINTFVIGEIKGAEALHCFITAMNTGAEFMGTIHANNAYASIDRLAHCAKLASDYSVPMLMQMMTGLKFCLIHLSYYKIDEIVELCGWDEDKEKLIPHTVYKRSVFND
jgi:pilus assembly protein CpaF